MKIRINNDPASPLQKAFQVPLDLDQRIEVEKLLMMEKILERLALLKMKKKDLAAAMKVSPARITAMLDGTNNFTMDTLVRAADALDCEFQISLKSRVETTAEEEGE